MGESPALTIVIPAYNEELRLLPTLELVEEWLRGRSRSWEMIVVDDGSSDRTASLAREWAASRSGVDVVVLPENRGKGAAVRAGLARSRGELVLFSDADLSTPIGEFDGLERAIEGGCDVAIGSRGLRDSRIEVRQVWYRERMGKTFNLVVRFVTGIPFLDTQCGFKLFRGGCARDLAADLVEDGFTFDVELLLLANRRGLVVRELPVTWRNDDRSRVDPVTDSWRMLCSLPRILARTGRYRRGRVSSKGSQSDS